jgi:hypothetical protein
MNCVSDGLLFWHGILILFNSNGNTCFQQISKKNKMKKIFYSIVLTLSIGCSLAFAGDGHPEVSKKVLASFNDRFAGAINVFWEHERDFEKATFQFDDVVFFAYFDTDGQWVATARNILSNQLPIPLLLQLKKEYNDCWITGLVEVDTETSISYYIYLENENKSVVLRSLDIDGWNLFSKTKKE